MTESFLHYLWQFQYFNKNELRTTQGDVLQIFHPGQKNTHAGPDFFNARLKIGATEWVGNVEIHIQAGSWMDHHHHEDAAYENVVLHVVWSNDKPVCRNDGSPLPALELKHRVDHKLLTDFRLLLQTPGAIPCAPQLAEVPDLVKISMLDRALMHRLEAKTAVINDLLKRNRNNWEETCYQWLARNFGFKVNVDPFQQLARALPYRLLLKHGDQLLQVEALLFGQAGFLEADETDDYFSKLKREYHLLCHKYQLWGKQMQKAQWKFMRLRPANFPTLRIAQCASLIHQRPKLFSNLMEAETAKELAEIFSVPQSDYWQRHYQFFKPARDVVANIGEASVGNIIINTVAPLLVAYGKSKDENLYVDRAVAILQQVHAEANRIIQQWKNVGLACKTAFDSQALVELYNNFCLKRRCLECSIGASLVKPGRPV
ncbi:Protein of unknown function [Chryseolinea serpens]|uniref:DUF2851 domain-containing protein n=1 Tax=Chryseolinea serpens TaxID=947013 RepID=A0A1M5TK35_9BACT|nr:DUF2851 family protein [Chryseolinea serpens]SHH51059.1 Protein of unknown function [Chryseolinea serpens]